MQEYIHGLGRLVEQHTLGPLQIYMQMLSDLLYSDVGRFAKLYYYLLATDQQYICACITMAFCGEIYKYDVKGRPSDGIKDNI